MSRIVYYKLIFMSFLFFCESTVFAKLLRPSKNRDQKEILVINSKRRVYYPIKKEGLVYQINGPTRTEFISRLPVLKKKNNSHGFNYVIILNQKDTIKVNHRYKVESSVRSIQHPKHRYTYSGNYFINLPKGNHTVEIFQGGDLKYPVLLRLLSKEFEAPNKNQEILMPMVHKNSVTIDLDGKNIKYFECSKNIPLQLEAVGPKTLRIISRLEFTEKMGTQESYRIHVKSGKKVIGTYFFNTERSGFSKINNRPERVPGKWRSCEIKVPKGKQAFSIEVFDEEKTVLTRFMLY
jgi:hypothetical protein